jgi:hypothetical protein
MASGNLKYFQRTERNVRIDSHEGKLCETQKYLRCSKRITQEFIKNIDLYMYVNAYFCILYEEHDDAKLHVIARFGCVYFTGAITIGVRKPHLSYA